MAKTKPSIFSEFLQPTEEMDEYVRSSESAKTRRARLRKTDEFNEIGVVPDPSQEMLDLRARYSNARELYIPVESGLVLPGFDTQVMPTHYVHAHAEIFTNSTGIKPLGPCQVESTYHSQIIIQHGGRIVKAEPRGFGKTSRSCNEFLLGVLQGYIKYGLIICSSIEKAEEIILSLITEILENEMLEKLYPREVAAFRHVEANPRKAEAQTYDGEFTHIKFNAGLIRFPVLPDSASSSAILNIRTKKNVRGIYFVDRAGLYAGQRRRPGHVLLDDIQTDEEAENEKTAQKIVRLIKKSVLRSGGHTKRLAAIMTCTPIAPGDVSHHFLLKEPWQHVIYQMLECRSDNEEMWLGEYATLLTDFDKRVPGSQIRAALRALNYYKDNQEEMDKGAVANWEWCYEYSDDPQVEISAVQHAYNIMILEGVEVFESECQCNVMQSGHITDITYCNMETILSRINTLKRYQLGISDRYVVTHIDVGLDYLTYMTVSSGPNFKGHIIDYGTFPEYPHRFAKGKMSDTLRKRYGNIPIPEERLTVAAYELINKIASKTYIREDGVLFKNNLITIDESRYTDFIQAAVRTSPHRHIVFTAQGTGLRARDKGIEEKNYSEACTKYHRCVMMPTPDRTLLKLLMDVNYWKCEVHLGFSREPTQAGSLSMFAEDFNNQHIMIAEHCIAEIPSWDVDPRSDKRIVVWTEVGENELFDNAVGCLAGLASLGVSYTVQADNSTGQSYDINKFINDYS